MAKFSKINLQNIVVNIAEFDNEEQAESFGGVWSPYQLGDCLLYTSDAADE